jgi:hypothetical protein
MPYRTIEVYFDPEQILDYQGIKIFRAYNHDNIDNPCQWCFSLETEEEFDIRDYDSPTCRIIKETAWLYKDKVYQDQDIVRALQELIHLGYFLTVTGKDKSHDI